MSQNNPLETSSLSYMVRSTQPMLNGEVAKYHFVNVFLLKLIYEILPSESGMVNHVLSNMILPVQWFGGSDYKRYYLSAFVLRQSDTFPPPPMFHGFCFAVYITYIMDKSKFCNMWFLNVGVWQCMAK